MDKLSRIRGCLLAGACGDALGYPVEFISGADIRKQYGDAGVRELSSFGSAAEISDDTQMTMFTAEGMLYALRHRADVTECVYQSYLDWLSTQMPSKQPGRYSQESLSLREPALRQWRAPGNTCLSALGSGRMGTIAEPLNQSKGCGGVMRAAPAGMLRLMDTPDPEDAYAMQGAAFAAITHGHPLGWLPGAMLADMVHQCLREEAASLADIARKSLYRLHRLWSDNAYWQDFDTLMKKAMGLSVLNLPDEEAIGQLGEGWVGEEALAIALYCCLRHPDSMEDCLCAAVTHGGDSDSTGAIAGNLLGAYRGAEAIPARWLDRLEARVLIGVMARQLAGASA